MLKYQLAVKAHLDLLMSPFLFYSFSIPFPFFHAASRPRWVACSQPPSLWCQQPGRTLNEPMSHRPGIAAVSNQRASNQPSEPALLPHKGPPSIGSIRALGHTLARDVNLPTALAAREARLAIRAISITESSSLLGRERAVAGYQ